jgi:preprotein translocase subunit YajC
MALVLPFLLLFGLLFLMNRGEKKKRTTFESKLKRGDRVITRAGIKGKLLEVTDTAVKVEIAPGVPVLMVKGAVEALDAGDTAASDPKGGKDASDGKDAKDKKK